MRLFSERRNIENRWSGGRDLNPRPSEWQSDALPTELQPHMVSPTPERVSRSLREPTPESGADSPIRTDVDFRLVVTNHVQSTTMRYRQI